MKDRLKNILCQPIADVKKLFGDASARIYHRIFLSNGKTFILMAMPKGKMSVSEEITNLKEKPAELPFINIQKYLSGIGLPVPATHHFSEEERWLILEDVGDIKLWDLVANADTATRSRWYKKAIDLLVEVQKKTGRPTPKMRATCVAFRRHFDATLFNWEFGHFLEYYFQLENRLPPSASDKKLFKEETRRITNALCRFPQIFTHRDYQSRNLMVRENQFYILDFQDALMGPPTYDIVALLRDSYIDLTPQLPELIRYYCAQAGVDENDFQRAFDLQTVQRKLKDAGRFVFIDRVKKNPIFLPFIPTSLSYVRQALDRLPEYRPLYEMLQKYVREWQ